VLLLPCVFKFEFNSLLQKAFVNNFTIFITLKENKLILHQLIKSISYPSRPLWISSDAIRALQRPLHFSSNDEWVTPSLLALLRRHFVWWYPYFQQDFWGTHSSSSVGFLFTPTRPIFSQIFKMCFWTIKNRILRSYYLRCKSGAGSFQNWCHACMAHTIFFEVPTWISKPNGVLSSFH